MLDIVFENQGAHTYLVYELKENDVIDTLGMGMMTNNSINGLAPMLYTQLNNQRFMKYNISSKVTLDQFLMGTVTKKRILGVLSSIAEALLLIEEYMIDMDTVVLDPQFIYADVSTSKALLISVPIVNKLTESVSALDFFKKIVYGAQFDQSENCTYVANIINFLNSSLVFSLYEFNQLVESLMVEDMNLGKATNPSMPISATPVSPVSANVASINTVAVNTVVSQANHGVGNIPSNISPQPMIQNTHSAGQQPVVQPYQQQAQQNYQANNMMASSVPSQEYNGEDDGKKKKGWSLFGSKNTKTKEKPEKEKKSKEKKANEIKIPKNIRNIPGAPTPINTGNASGQPMNAYQQGTPMQQPQASNPIQQRPQAPAQQPVVPTQQRPQAPGQQPIMPTQQRPQAPAQQSVMPVQQRPLTPTQQAPMQQSQPVMPMNGQGVQSSNFGETTVLGGGMASGETMVLSMNPSIETTPYLIRSKSNEKIKLTKPVFRIGKEKSYVDYFIGDNTAVSRSHANIIIQNNEYFVVDTNSTNHTYVNDMMIQSNTEVKLTHGMKLRLANEEFEFKIY